MIVSFAVFTTALFGSCTSKEGSGEEPESPTTSYKVRVKVSTGEYTRAGDDAAVNTLHLAFYNDEECLGIVEATKVGSVFECSIPTEYGKPDGVIAFANLPADDLPTTDNVMTKAYSNLGNGDNMIMSSARYFDASGNDKLKIPLTTMNLIEGGDAVNIKLDRIAAKVTVKSAVDVKFDSFKLLCGVNGTKDFEFNILSWGLTAIEKNSYLIKSFGNNTFSLLNTELDGWANWNVKDSFVSHWAHSVSWNNSTDNYPKGYTLTGDYSLDYPVLNNISNNIGSSIYYHETTRPKDVYTTDNAVASLVIIGKYGCSELLNEVTFYQYDSQVYTSDDLIKVFLDKQKFLYDSNGKLITRSTPSVIDNFELAMQGNGIPDNLVTLQLKETASLFGQFRDKDGNQYLDKNIINNALAVELGYAEMYKDGKCYFIVPIRNNTVEDPGSVTGSYGLVRNHHYDITINSISGLGTGIASEDCVPLKYTYSGQSSSAYKVNANVSVNEWHDVNQTVDIPKN